MCRLAAAGGVCLDVVPMCVVVVRAHPATQRAPRRPQVASERGVAVWWLHARGCTWMIANAIRELPLTHHSPGRLMGGTVHHAQNICVEFMTCNLCIWYVLLYSIVILPCRKLTAARVRGSGQNCL